VPKDVDVLGDRGWAIVIDVDPSGLCLGRGRRTQARSTTKKMQLDAAEASKERIDAGLDSMVLLG
jgi:hypothetical protein